MTLLYRDRDRLLISVFIALLRYLSQAPIDPLS